MSVLKTGTRAQSQQLGKLLDEGQYARLAEHLFEFRSSVEKTNQQDLRNLIIAALQICVLCQQCHSEMEWHRRANREVLQRVKELNGQLHSLLNLILEYETLKDSQLPTVTVNITPRQEGDQPQAGKPHTIWQRIQELFNFEPEPPTPIREKSRVIVDALFTELVENDELLVNPDHAKDEETSGNEKSGSSVSLESEIHGISSVVSENPESVEQVEKSTKPTSDTGRTVTTISPTEKTAQNSVPPPSLMAYCFGSFRVFLDDQSIDEWASSKGKSIFKYMLIHRDQIITRDILMELFWPEASPDAARNNLNVAIYGLRQTFRAVSEKTVIELEDGVYRINPSLYIWVDVEAFEGHHQNAQRLEDSGDLDLAIKELEMATNLYHGDFLTDDLYEEWTILTRERLRLAYLDSLTQLSQISFSRGEYSASVMLCQQILDYDICREDAHRRLIRCYSRQGQRHLALRQFQLCQEALRHELDIDPEPATIQLVRLIRNQEIV